MNKIWTAIAIGFVVVMLGFVVSSAWHVPSAPVGHPVASEEPVPTATACPTLVRADDQRANYMACRYAKPGMPNVGAEPSPEPTVCSIIVAGPPPTGISGLPRAKNYDEMPHVVCMRIP